MADAVATAEIARKLALRGGETEPRYGELNREAAAKPNRATAAKPNRATAN
ncbi:MAG TPA: hypothetical protein VFW27_31895 [Actinoplanes sp.]|nr:hypothetical protein [Actinoplanes sp.]